MGARASLLSVLQQQETFSEADTNSIFADYDANKSYYLEKAEGDRFFRDVLALSPTGAEIADELLPICWEEFDLHEDGKLDIEEVKQCILQCFFQDQALFRGVISGYFSKLGTFDLFSNIAGHKSKLMRSVLCFPHLPSILQEGVDTTALYNEGMPLVWFSNLIDSQQSLWNQSQQKERRWNWSQPKERSWNQSEQKERSWKQVTQQHLGESMTPLEAAWACWDYSMAVVLLEAGPPLSVAAWKQCLQRLCDPHCVNQLCRTSSSISEAASLIRLLIQLEDIFLADPATASALDSTALRFDVKCLENFIQSVVAHNGGKTVTDEDSASTQRAIMLLMTRCERSFGALSCHRPLIVHSHLMPLLLCCPTLLKNGFVSAAAALAARLPSASHIFVLSSYAHRQALDGRLLDTFTKLYEVAFRDSKVSRDARGIIGDMMGLLAKNETKHRTNAMTKLVKVLLSFATGEGASSNSASLHPIFVPLMAIPSSILNAAATSVLQHCLDPLKQLLSRGVPCTSTNMLVHSLLSHGCSLNTPESDTMQESVKQENWKFLTTNLGPPHGTIPYWYNTVTGQIIGHGQGHTTHTNQHPFFFDKSGRPFPSALATFRHHAQTGCCIYTCPSRPATLTAGVRLPSLSYNGRIWSEGSKKHLLGTIQFGFYEALALSGCDLRLLDPQLAIKEGFPQRLRNLTGQLTNILLDFTAFSEVYLAEIVLQYAGCIQNDFDFKTFRRVPKASESQAQCGHVVYELEYIQPPRLYEKGIVLVRSRMSPTQ